MLLVLALLATVSAGSNEVDIHGLHPDMLSTHTSGVGQPLRYCWSVGRVSTAFYAETCPVTNLADAADVWTAATISRAAWDAVLEDKGWDDDVSGMCSTAASNQTGLTQAGCLDLLFEADKRAGTVAREVR